MAANPRKKKTRKLRSSMAVMLLAGWLLPLALIAFVLLYLVSAMLNRQIENTIKLSMGNAAEICEIQLAEVVSASKNASYISTVRNSYEQYLVDGKSEILYKEITNFLNQYYKYDESIICTMLFFLDNPGQIYYAANSFQESEKLASGYSPVQFFREENMAEVMKLGSGLDTEVELVYLKDRLYLIRNIVDTYYQPYAMIVIEMDPERTFQSLQSVWGVIGHNVYIDDAPILDNETARTDFVAGYTIDPGESAYIRGSLDAFALKSIKFAKRELTFLAELDTKAIIDELAIIRYSFILLFIFLVPLNGIIFYFFHTRVTRPVSNLIGASKRIQAGEYGYQIAETGNSEEFNILTDAYNAMSQELEHQFRQIYLEELALRDANINALQAQINPHFLNNTLEIINWEARMNGNEKVSGMIEALGTMLSFTMNRKQLHFHSLAEEMTYADAYFYIISKRFENRFEVEKEIDRRLLPVEVPRLLIQPILENAVEHGMKDQKRGKVLIRIYTAGEGTEKYMYIEVVNDRKLGEKERERIHQLLNEQEGHREGRGSLGIRNVNERLKIIYGDSSGLTIDSDGKGNTVSTLRIKMGEMEQWEEREKN